MSLLRCAELQSAQKQDQVRSLSLLLHDPILSHLEGLCLHRSINQEELQQLSIANLRHIKLLDLSNNYLPENALLAFFERQTLPNLEQLDLSSNHTTPKVVQCLVERHMLTKARRLDLSYTPITPETLRQLASNTALPVLRHLQLNGQHVTNTPGLNDLFRTHHQHLTSLSLINCGLEGSSAARLLSNNPWPELTTLKLGFNRLGSDGLAALSAINAPKLAHLELNNNQISIGGWHQFTLTITSPIHTLNAYQNPADSELVQTLLHHFIPTLSPKDTTSSTTTNAQNPHITAAEFHALLLDERLPLQTRQMVLERLENQNIALVRTLGLKLSKEATLHTEAHRGVRMWLISVLTQMRMLELKTMASNLNLALPTNCRKPQLIAAVRDALDNI